MSSRVLPDKKPILPTLLGRRVPTPLRVPSIQARIPCNGTGRRLLYYFRFCTRPFPSPLDDEGSPSPPTLTPHTGRQTDHRPHRQHRPICTPTFILTHSTVWPQYTHGHVTDRTGHTGQRSDVKWVGFNVPLNTLLKKLTTHVCALCVLSTASPRHVYNAVCVQSCGLLLGDRYWMGTISFLHPSSALS